MLGKQMFVKNHFNLFPKSIERQQSIEKMIRYLLFTIWIGSFCFSLYTLFLYQQMHSLNIIKESHLTQIQRAKPLVELDAIIKRYKQDLNKITVYQNSINTVEAPMFEILKELERVIPTDVTLSSFTLNEDGKIQIVGMSKNEFVASDLVISIKGMDKLSNVYLKSVSKKEDEKDKSGTYISIFNIECQVTDLIAKTDAKTDKKAADKAPTDNGGTQ